MLRTKFPDVRQVLTLGLPSPELLGGPDLSPEFARVANDGMAQMCLKWPRQFPAFVASLPMNNIPEALKEMDRAIDELGAKGMQIITSVAGRPLDDPEFFPVFERMANHHDRPIWMHPARPANRPDYPGEPKSKYEIWQVLGWPFETSVAMARMVFSGLLQRLPKLRIITHHCGGMIPYFAGRAETLWAQLGSRSSDSEEAEVLKRLRKPPIEYFKMFYGDTVLGGAAAPLACGIAFFGADHVVFASDCPFDPEGGPMFIREGIKSVEALNLPEGDKGRIYFGNAMKLCAWNETRRHRPRHPRALGVRHRGRATAGRARQGRRPASDRAVGHPQRDARAAHRARSGRHRISRHRLSARQRAPEEHRPGGAFRIHGRQAAPREKRRHPGMHRTRTLDYAIVLSGEIYAVLDEGEVLLKAGDVLVQRGTNHAWSNRSARPCRIAFVLVDAS